MSNSLRPFIITSVIPRVIPLFFENNKSSRVILSESINSDIFSASLHFSFRNKFRLKLFVILLLVVFPNFGINVFICSCCPFMIFIISSLSLMSFNNISSFVTLLDVLTIIFSSSFLFVSVIVSLLS